MSTIFLFRHGQAGSRHDYDRLSDIGQQQAALLGRHMAAEGLRFRAFFTGGLRRQQETAAAVRQAYLEAGLELPEPQLDPQWSEFDLEGVYRSIAPQLAADDPEFGRHFEALQREAALASSEVHRRWTPSDIAVVRAWIAGTYKCEVESWRDFVARVQGAATVFRQFGNGDAIAVSTSATPIAVFTALAMGLDDRNTMRAAGVLYNSSFSTFRLRDADLALFSFNNIPHLRRAEMRTFR